MNNDLISRSALYRQVKTECNPYGKPTIDFESGNKVLDLIDNAPTVEITELCKSCQYLKDCEICEEKERLSLLCSDMLNEIARLKSMTGER